MLKRKIKPTPSSCKKVKISHNIEDLPWTTVSRFQESGVDGDDGILDLEEIEGVEVVYEETENGRIARFNLVRDVEDPQHEPDNEREYSGRLEDKVETDLAPVQEEVYEHFDSETFLPDWHTYSLHPQILRTLHTKKFLSPTPIQSASLPVALAGRDVVGVAQTGSGKTLAYGLPILQHLLSQPPPMPRKRRPVRALILAPTRELSLQVSAHLNACLNRLTPPGHANLPSRLNNLRNSFQSRFERIGDPADIESAISNQQCAVEPTPLGHADLPSRLNNLGNSFQSRFERIRDPADIDSAISNQQRAVEENTTVNEPHGTVLEHEKSSNKGKGKGKKMDASSTAKLPKSPPHVSVAAVVGGMSAQKQRRILDRGVDILVATPGRLWDIMEADDDLSREVKNLRFLVLDEADRMIETGHFAELENILRLTLRENKEDQIPGMDGEGEAEAEDTMAKDGLQTFVFSATLSKNLQRNVKRRTRPKSAGKHKKHDEQPASTLDDLLLRLDFRDPDPVVIDLSPAGDVVSTLKESKIECLSADKDVYLYYFLLRYPGKSLVFLSSIDGIRRLMPLTELLNLKAFPLHSQLEQRQRLKNLDRFTNTPNSILLATDIAARGLDISAVDHVIHYQIPRSADSYVHRNGRTARASRKGFSMLMCAPDERRIVRAFLGNLGRQESEIPELPVQLDLLDKLKYRVQLARKIETAHHKVKKANHERNWMKETAAAMELELDSDYLSDEDGDQPSGQKRKAKDAKNAALKAELKHLLSQPLFARGISTRYITSGSTPIVDDLLAGEFNEGMVGVKKEGAGSNLVASKNKSKNVRKRRE